MARWRGNGIKNTEKYRWDYYDNIITNMSKFLDVALQAAELAKTIILDNRDKPYSLEIKKDNSVVTDLDKQIELEIKQLIQTHFPSHGFYGEEFGKDSVDADYIWIIDPIDGSREFARGLPFFSTFIALVKNDEFILGISSSPMLDELLYAERGKGTWLNGQQVKVSNVSNLQESFILGPAYKYLDRTNTFSSMAKLSHDVQGTRNVGAFGYHWVASGKAEAMIEIDTLIYNVAPFVTIIREAGGTITDLTGDPIILESKTFLASNTILHKKILNYFNSQ